MNTGMLWFDNDPKANLATKIQRAVDYYRRKYGEKPNLCFVHPSMVGSSALPSGAVEIRTNRQILPNHFWIGLSNKAQFPQSGANGG